MPAAMHELSRSRWPQSITRLGGFSCPASWVDLAAPTQRERSGRVSAPGSEESLAGLRPGFASPVRPYLKKATPMWSEGTHLSRAVQLGSARQAQIFSRSHGAENGQGMCSSRWLGMGDMTRHLWQSMRCKKYCTQGSS